MKYVVAASHRDYAQWRRRWHVAPDEARYAPSPSSLRGFAGTVAFLPGWEQGRSPATINAFKEAAALCEMARQLAM